jgi:hypothetical protein
MLECVACLTTIPSRLDDIHLTLDSLSNQTVPFDKVYLCIPYVSKRFNIPYEIPESLLQRTDIVILRCSDHGPATKVLGLLEANLPEIGKTTRIFYCDDDRVYPSVIRDVYYKTSVEFPDRVICLATTSYWKFYVNDIIRDYNSDKQFPAARYRVRDGFTDIAEGFGGVMVQPRFFTKDVYQIPPECRVVDDIWLSGHYRKNNFKIWGLSTFESPVTHNGDKKDALYLLKGENDRKLCNSRCIEYYQTHYGIWDTVDHITLDSKLTLPQIPNISRLLSLLQDVSPLLELTPPTLPSIQKPDEYVFELNLLKHTDTIETPISGLIEDCEKIMELHSDYLITTSYLRDHKLAANTSELTTRLMTPIHQFVKEKDLKKRVESYIRMYSQYRENILKCTIFKKRLLCHKCSIHIYHFVVIPCGHIICESCKTDPVNCPHCLRPITMIQSVVL